MGLFLFRFHGLVRIDDGELFMKFLFLLFQLAVLVDEHTNHNKQNRQSDQIQPSETQAGMLQKKCHFEFRLPFLLPSP